VIIGNVVLGIQGMTFSFWLILFSLSCFSNLMGLLISSSFSSVVAIYIMVPLIIVPQMLLSGVVVNYDKLNNYVASKEYVPVVGDIMASRWAYEALIVTQFKHNAFQKHYFGIEKQESNTKYNLLFVIPEIKKIINDIRSHPDNATYPKAKLEFLRNEVQTLIEAGYSSYFDNIIIDAPKFQQLENHLNILNKDLSNTLDILGKRKDDITHQLVAQYGSIDNYLTFKNQYYNENLADLVLKRKSLEAFVKTENRIIRVIEPIYQNPGSNLGRAHFLSSSKKIGDLTIDTLLFNIIIIWLMSMTLYTILVFFFACNKQK
jgi:ABC transport system ATP-binding/permease protein